MTKIGIGDEAIEFTLRGVDEIQHSLSDYGGKHVAVIFSCNHCPYVRAWEDRIIKTQADYGNKGLQVIAINSNDGAKYPDDSYPKMKERAREKKFDFPYLHDEDQHVARAYGAERTPEVFLFDSKRILRYHGTIDDNYDDPRGVKRHYFRDAIDSVLIGRQVPIPETSPVGCTIKWK